VSATQPLVVRPGPPLSGVLRPPGDESITHRALLLGLLADGTTTIEGGNPGGDCLATRRCAAALGARFEGPADDVRLRGTGGRLTAPSAVLDCGDSGTTLRLLAGMLAGQPFVATLAGDESLTRRPVDRVVEPLRAMGASLSARDGDRLPPLTVCGGSLRGMSFPHPTASAQVSSAILLAAVQAKGDTALSTATGVRDHTVRMLRSFGVTVTQRARACGAVELRLAGPVPLRACRVRVPGDFSAAACFLAAAAATPGAHVQARGVGLDESRILLLEVLKDMGAEVEVANVALLGEEPVGDVTVSGPERLTPGYIPASHVVGLLDEIPAWSVAASAAHGVSRLRGAEGSRSGEDGRLSALAAGLGALGVRVVESAGGLDIHGGPVGGGTVTARGDHRIAMALSLLGTRASGPVRVHEAACVGTSYPGFVAALRSLGGRVAGTEGEGAAA
jgi:3-phosphoshikimate 1-carboxyvinyltransferase